MARFSQNKGKAGEREVCTLFRAPMHNAEVKAGYTTEISDGIRRTSGMAAASGGSDIVGIPGICVEVKNAKRLCIPQWWRQAKIQARIELKNELYAVLVYKIERKGWRTMFVYQGSEVDWSLSDFLTRVYMPWYVQTYLPSKGERVS